jgi:DNA-binding LytR/AlgR family response regulator
LDVPDYLLKPVSFDRFLKVANKAFDYFQLKRQHNEEYFFVKAENKMEKINFNDILFVEAMENYVAIYLSDRKIITHSTLKMIQEA